MFVPRRSQRIASHALEAAGKAALVAGGIGIVNKSASAIAKNMIDMKFKPRRGRKGKGLRGAAPSNPNRAVTVQHDFQVQKRRSRRGGKKMKRVMRFRSKVLNALTAYHNPQWMRFYDTSKGILAGIGQQQMFVIGTLYGCSGVAGSGATADNRDLLQIHQTCVTRNGFQDSAGALGTMANRNDNKIRIQSAYLESTLTNTDVGICLLDVYECYCRKTVGAPTTNTITNLLQEMPLNQWPGIAGTSIIQQFQIGITPYQSPNFRTAFKIGTKTRYMIQPGQSITVKMSGMGQRTLYGTSLENITYPALKGWTRCLVGVLRGVETSATSAGASLSYDSLRMYNVDPQNDMYPNTGTNVPA